MTHNASNQTIRLGEAASALDVPPKQVRNWVGEGRFNLVADATREKNKWREFSFFDLAHLSIAAQLISYGFTIDEAHDFSGAALCRMLGPLYSQKTLAQMPAAALLAMCRGKDLYLFRLSDGDAVSFLSPADEVPEYHAAVHINLTMCIGMTFQGLADMGHDAFEPSRTNASLAGANIEHGATVPFDHPANVERQSAISERGHGAPASKKEEA